MNSDTTPPPRTPDAWQSLRALVAGFVAGMLARPLLARLLRRTRRQTPPVTPAERTPRESPPPEAPGRRRFLRRIAMAGGGLIAVVLGVPLVSFLFGKPAPAPRVWRRVGSVDDFVIGETVQVSYRDAAPLPWAGFAAESAAWLRRDADAEFVAFTLYCTHTGCPVRWIETASLFMCPCHGGVFHRDGTVAAGPPPVPLTRYPVRVREGAVEILTTPIPGRQL